MLLEAHESSCSRAAGARNAKIGAAPQKFVWSGKVIWAGSVIAPDEPFINPKWEFYNWRLALFESTVEILPQVRRDANSEGRFRHFSSEPI